MHAHLSDATSRASTGAARALPPFAIHTCEAAGAFTISVCGEADETSKARLRALPAEIDLTRTPQVQLDLSHLEFCDVGTAGGLIDLAARVRASGGTVQVVHAPGVFVRLMIETLDVAGDLPLPPVPAEAD